MRLALLSNVTLELLVPMLSDHHELWCPSGYGAWAETALNPPDELKAFRPEVAVLLLDRSQNRVDGNRVAQVTNALEARFAGLSVLVVDLEDLSAEIPGFYDTRLWQLARMPWSQQGLEAIAAEIERQLKVLNEGGRKVLALDLDGVLWQGVIGEDGVEGVEPNAELQHWLKGLQACGVVLTILSRNNPEDVDPVWSDSRMVLKREDFAASRIDWVEKAENLSAIARELNLGTDSFVFLDDNPAERLAMAARHPEVAVPEFPSDFKSLPRFLRRLERLYFPRRRLTDEDRARTKAYQAESARQELKLSLGFDDYLESLMIRVDVHPMRESEIERVTQLSVKTNQFNVCTNRYSRDEVGRFFADPTRRIFTASVADRYGELGLVAFVQVVLDGARAEIVDWVMSCRAMNRRIEFTIEREVESALMRQGVQQLAGTYRPTAKNRPVEGLFESFGFKVVDTECNIRSFCKFL